jgi:hypothetical protein
MAKQTFTTGQVLTAAQMTSLQQTAMSGGAASAKVASYVLVAADGGTAISMTNAGATTITVNTGLFAAGDTVTIVNLGAGVCTVTAGTATVSTSGSLVLAQNQGGILYFTSSGAALFLQFATPASGDIEGVTAGTGLSGGGTSGTVTLAIDSTVATLTGSQTLTNKTITSPIVSDAIIKGFEEDVNVVASAATGTINFNIGTASVWYYTTNATANHTLNFRYDGSTSLNSVLAVGDAITVVWLNTNGATAYYPNVIQIDTTAVTPKVPAAISAGNASSIDAYVFTIIKTAATPTYTVLETQTKFA